MKNLLIVEDDAGIRMQMKWGLSQKYNVTMAEDGNKALIAIKDISPDVVILDLGLPPNEDDVTEGFVCLKNILDLSPYTKVIVVTGNDEKENALKAIGLGAYDFYPKPIDLEVLKIIIQRAFHLTGLEQEHDELKQRISGKNMFEGMLGSTPKMIEVFSSIKKVATTDATILITGESGTGKELVSKAIHSRSLRKNKPFVPINCGSIPESLIESELFGYEKGAFTDAKAQKIGLVERASGGTLFLDEIGELPKHLQVKLLRFIQERKIQRVGGSVEIEVDLRIIAATNVDLEEAVKIKSFREDLFFRISVINIALPPLREREDDIYMLAKNFLTRFSKENSKKLKGFSSGAIKALQRHGWPGNVRELENKVQRAVIMTDGPLITTKDLSLYSKKKEIAEITTPTTLREARTRIEIDTIQTALSQNSGNISKAAETLGVSRPTLHDLINKYGLKPK